MLQAMQQPASSRPSPSSASFAGLLAALTSPGKKEPVGWNDDDLADDVATLSYERALRAHSRYKAPDATDRALTQPRTPANVRGLEAMPYEPDSTPPVEAAPSVAVVAGPDTEACSAADRNLKRASITIRLSKAECLQLRRRAAEAGLTVSAYMRSCTFEAEALRALVKDTLAEIRSESPSHVAAGNPTVESTRSWWNWLGQLWPHSRAGQRAAQS